MNLKQLQYALELSETCNFSKASENLNITQPALSKQIMLLERDLGVKLFNRTCTPLCLTPAGEHFMQEARELIYREENLRRSMKNFGTGERGRLTIGISPFRSLYLIPTIVKKIQERFPGIEIVLRDTNSDQNRKEVLDGKLDFAIVNLPVDDLFFEYIPLEPDVLVLAVPNSMLDSISNIPSGNLADISFEDCAKLSFVVVEPSNEMRLLFDKLCVAADFHPTIAMEVVGITTAWAMTQAGIGATLVPLQFISKDTFRSNNITLFKIKNNSYSRQPVIITRRGQTLSEHAKYAIELLTAES